MTPLLSPTLPNHTPHAQSLTTKGSQRDSSHADILTWLSLQAVIRLSQIQNHTCFGMNSSLANSCRLFATI